MKYMKNTNIINKYTLLFATLLLAVVFSIAMPFAAKAQDDTDYTGTGYTDYSGTGYTDGTDYTGTGYTDYTGTGYTDYTGTGYTDYTGTGYTEPTSNDTQTIVPYDNSSVGIIGGIYSGGYYGGYYYPGSTVSSGSFTGGTLYEPVPTAGQYPGSTVTTSSFGGGTAYNGYYGYNNYNYGQLTGSCSGQVSTNPSGTSIVWTALASGGNGVYYYTWTGDSGLSGTGQYISQIYPSSTGVENAYLRINSGDGQTTTEACSVTLGNPNEVLAYSATNPNLQSVYLSNVPYTGAGDFAKVVGFLSMLLLWSAGLSYIFLKRKEKMENPITVTPEASNSSESSDYLQNFRMETNSDIQAIESIETYARMNQVLLSSDAVKELAKLSRLNKINPKEAIKKMSKGEWITIGENDLSKFI